MKAVMDRRGQVLVEFALVFPLQLLVTLVILQLAWLYVAKDVVNYAAVMASRAELVGGDPAATAAAVCAPVAGISDVGSESAISYPGWGVLDRSDISRARTEVSVTTPLEEGKEYVEVEVVCRVELIFPVANRIVAWIPLLPEENYGETFSGIPDVAVKAVHRRIVPWRVKLQ